MNWFSGGQYLSLVEYKYDHINLFELELPELPEFQLDNREVSWGAVSRPEQALALNLFPTLRIYLQDKHAGRRPGSKNIAQGRSQDQPD